MPGWITDVQGYREILDAAGNPVQRRKSFQVIGATVTDNGSVSVIEVPAGPTGATGSNDPTGIRGVGLTVTGGKLTPRVRPRQQNLVDLFSSGNTTSGSIGSLGWNLLGTGTPVYTRLDGSFSSSQKNSLTTSGSANDRSILSLGETETRDVITAVTLMIAQWTARLPSLASVRFFYGCQSTLATEPSATSDSLGMYYDSAVSPNWQLIARTGGSNSPFDTGVAVLNDSPELLTIYQDPIGTFQFWSNDVLLGTRTGVTTSAMNFGVRLETLTASAKTARVSYANLQIVPAAGDGYYGDNFLEA